MIDDMTRSRVHRSRIENPMSTTTWVQETAAVETPVPTEFWSFYMKLSRASAETTRLCAPKVSFSRCPLLHSEGTTS